MLFLLKQETMITVTEPSIAFPHSGWWEEKLLSVLCDF